MMFPSTGCVFSKCFLVLFSFRLHSRGYLVSGKAVEPVCGVEISNSHKVFVQDAGHELKTPVAMNSDPGGESG